MQHVDVPCPLGDDRYDLFSLPELVDKTRALGVHWTAKQWVGNKGTEECLRDIERGDETLVAKSDELMAKIEDQVPVTTGKKNIDDVVGAIPNVPAFLAGHPQCMRRREHVPRDNAPVTIFMDLTSSGGISSRDLLSRGCTLLALTRLLVEHRPVELWVGIALGARGWRRTVAWRIDTAPLDLARAAHSIAHPSMARGLGYDVAAELEKRESSRRWAGGWPFENHREHVDCQEQGLREAFFGTELLYVPPIYLNDPMVKDPVGWVKRVMARYVKTDEEE